MQSALNPFAPLGPRGWTFSFWGAVLAFAGAYLAMKSLGSLLVGLPCVGLVGLFLTVLAVVLRIYLLFWRKESMLRAATTRPGEVADVRLRGISQFVAFTWCVLELRDGRRFVVGRGALAYELHTRLALHVLDHASRRRTHDLVHVEQVGQPATPASLRLISKSLVDA
jgi:hypothetical protein